MSNVLKDIFTTAKENSALYRYKDANARMQNGNLSPEELDYLKGAKMQGLVSGAMAVGQGVNGILNTALQAADIEDPTLYEYDIMSLRDRGGDNYYDYGQLASDYSNTNFNIGNVKDTDLRGMTNAQKWGTMGEGVMSGATAGLQVAGPWGAVVGGAIGAIGAGIGIDAGNRKATMEAMRLNQQAGMAQQYSKKNFSAAFENIADKKNRQAMANIAAEGGKFTNAAKKEHKTIQQFAQSVLAKRDAIKKVDMNKLASGGNMYNTHGGYYAPNVTKIESGGTHEQNPFGGVQLGVDPMGIPNLVEEGEIVYDDYVFSDRLKPTVSELREFGIPEKYEGKTFAYIADKLSDEAKERINDPISNNGMGVMYDRLIAMQDEHKQKKEMADLKRMLKKLGPNEQQAVVGAMLAMPQMQEPQVQQPELQAAGLDVMPQDAMPTMAAYGGGLTRRYTGGGGIVNLSSVNNMINRAKAAYKLMDYKGGPESIPAIERSAILSDNSLGEYQNEIIKDNVKRDIERIMQSRTPYETNYNPDKSTDEHMPMLPTGMRYAGAGYNLISGLHNLLQSPDKYSYRHLTPDTVSGDLTLDRLQYNPNDINLSLNQIDANAAATRRQMANSGLGASAGAALLANNYNTTMARGNAAWQTRLANQQQLASVTQANNQAASAEADYDYRRDYYNTNLRNQYGMYNLQNAMQIDAMNKQAEAQKWAAVSQSLDAAAQDLANIGTENFNMNMVNTNPALFYRLHPWFGDIDYKKPKKD